MRVILLKNIENIGKKFEIKEVKAGYARNFLFPEGLAKLATKEALTWLETQKEIEATKAEEELKEFQGKAGSLDGQEITISVRVGEQGELFQSINTQKITERLAEMGFTVKKSQIGLEGPIKDLGEYPIKIKFEHNLEAEIRLIVAEEK